MAYTARGRAAGFTGIEQELHAWAEGACWGPHRGLRQERTRRTGEQMSAEARRCLRAGLGVQSASDTVLALSFADARRLQACGPCQVPIELPSCTQMHYKQHTTSQTRVH